MGRLPISSKVTGGPLSIISFIIISCILGSIPLRGGGGFIFEEGFPFLSLNGILDALADRDIPLHTE